MKKTNIVKKLIAAACTVAMVLSFIPSTAFAHTWGTDMGGGSFGGESYSFSGSAPSDRGAYDFTPSYNAADNASSYRDPGYDAGNYGGPGMQEWNWSSAAGTQHYAAEEPARQMSGSENLQMPDVQTRQEAAVQVVLVTENTVVQNPAKEGSIPADASDETSSARQDAGSADSEVAAGEEPVTAVEEPAGRAAGEGEPVSAGAGVSSPVFSDAVVMQQPAPSSSVFTDDFGGKQFLSADNAVKNVQYSVSDYSAEKAPQEDTVLTSVAEAENPVVQDPGQVFNKH